MKSLGKRNVLGVLVDALDYEAAVNAIVESAANRRELAATALAVHGLMLGVADPSHRSRLNHLDLVTPDGQPVRWALNLLHRAGLRDRVYGPTLMLAVCEEARRQSLPVYLYGSTQEVVERLARNLEHRFPGLVVAGWEPSKFRPTTPEEKAAIAARIRDSGARILFVGLGCPRQEVFAYEYRQTLGMPVIAVGAAFDYHAGVLREPPPWIQRLGLQWLYRLCQEPGRLWRRYLISNPAYVALIGLQAMGLFRPNPDSGPPPLKDILVG